MPCFLRPVIYKSGFIAVMQFACSTTRGVADYRLLSFIFQVILEQYMKDSGHFDLLFLFYLRSYKFKEAVELHNVSYCNRATISI